MLSILDVIVRRSLRISSLQNMTTTSVLQRRWTQVLVTQTGHRKKSSSRRREQLTPENQRMVRYQQAESQSWHQLEDMPLNRPCPHRQAQMQLLLAIVRVAAAAIEMTRVTLLAAGARPRVKLAVDVLWQHQTRAS